jgi:hypothetical protein
MRSRRSIFQLPAGEYRRIQEEEHARSAAIAAACRDAGKVALTIIYLESGLSAEAVRRELGLADKPRSPCRGSEDPSRLWDAVLRTRGVRAKPVR